jgi:hypothetical protein
LDNDLDSKDCERKASRPATALENDDRVVARIEKMVELVY